MARAQIWKSTSSLASGGRAGDGAIARRRDREVVLAAQVRGRRRARPRHVTLLYFPGVDLGLIRHHERLAKMFEMWCLHIPVRDRTSFQDSTRLQRSSILVP